MSTPRDGRDARLDFLRALGLLLVILAHSIDRGLIFELRTFDVPLMVMVAGASYALASAPKSYGAYLLGRFQRLVLPCWLFLIVYYTLQMAVRGERGLNYAEVLDSFLFNGGVSYLWVILVFLMVGILAPFVTRCANRVTDARVWFVGVLVCAVLFSWLTPDYLASSPDSGIWGAVLFYVVPYGCVFGIGYRVSEFSVRARWGATLVVLLLSAVFVLPQTQTDSFSIDAFKYPPRIAYIAYGLFMSLVFWNCAPAILACLTRVGCAPAVAFLGANSIWIYLWHILTLRIVFLENGGLRFLCVLLLAVVLVLIQGWCVKRVLRRLSPRPTLARFIGRVLIG